MRLDPLASLLLVVDIHERLAPAICNRQEVIDRSRLLIRAAGTLGVPVVVSEHCPRQLGRTVDAILAEAPAGSIVEKTHFSCADEPAVRDRVAAAGRRQIVVTGMEAHVCVLQSALGFAERGYQVFAVADAIGSRTPEARALALERLRANAVETVNTEMVVFEWLGRADRPEFRELLPLIK